MIKYILLAVVAWALPCAMAHAGDTSPLQTQAQVAPIPTWDDIVRESIDATHAPDMELSLAGDPLPSDLTLDPNFSDDGMKAFFPYPKPDGATLHQDGLRVFPSTACYTLPPPAVPIPICFHDGYYVVGRVRNTDGSYSSAITHIKLDGSTDTNFGTNGWMYPSSSARQVVDAAMASDRMYILTTVDFAGVPAMKVTCTTLSTGNSCSGFFGLVTFGSAVDGAVRGAWARRIVYDSRYGLFIAGHIKTTARGWEMAVARLDADAGTLITEFRGNGKNTGLPGWAAQTNSDITVFDMAVVPAETPGGERLYVAGTIRLSATDYSGFVLGLNPTSGYTSVGWAWNKYDYDKGKVESKKDAITAIHVQRNGRLVMAGWTESDSASERFMFLARALPWGDANESFCSKAQYHGMCIPLRPLIGVNDNDLPVAIAERDGTRDLVVVLKTPLGESDYHPTQFVFQFSASGNALHGARRLDYPAGAGVTPWSRPYGMWMGHTGAFGIGDEVIAVVGTRKYNDASENFTIAHLIANDSIFADQFGGPHND